MKKLFLIGGMGAGKSTARKALTDEGLAWIDLDQVGHEVLMWDTVKDDLRGAFGDDIFDENGEVVRSALAAKAFATPAATRKLNTITMPRIEERYTDLIDGFEAEGKPAVVVEYSVFRNRQQSLAYGADVVMAVLAPLEVRIERAVASGLFRGGRARPHRPPDHRRRPHRGVGRGLQQRRHPRRAAQRGHLLVERVQEDDLVGCILRILAKALRALVLGALLWLYEGSDEFSGALILGLRN